MAMSDGRPNIAELVERHYRFLYRYAYRLSGSAVEAEDLTQQTFLQAQQRLEQLRDPASARGWLFTILRNQYRRQCRSPEPVLLPKLEQTPAPSPAPDLEVDADALQQALLETPEPFRTAVILFYFNEMSYRQIAEQMQVPIGTVMSRLSRGKAFLRGRLTTEGLKPAASVRKGPGGL